jgi:hypothetical protein
MAYIGRSVEYGNASTDSYVGNGGATYTLTYDTTTNGVVISLDGVIQKNGTDFNIVGTALTFTSVVSSPIVIQIIYLGLTIGIGVPADNTITNAKMASNAIDSAELVAGSVDDAHLATGITASKLSGIVPTANLGTGTASSTTVLYGDGTYKTEPVTANEITKQSAAPTISSPATPVVGDLILATSTGQMYSCSVVSSGANEWINIGDGTGSIEPVPAFTAATGGTITTDGDYKVHSFTTSGTFTVTAAAAAGVEYLVVAGGGGSPKSGATAGQAAGGGAGGMLTATGLAVLEQAYTITVGAGGAGQSLARGLNGSDSVFSSFTSVGGGGGGYSATSVAQAGGSGGGATSYDITGGLGTAGQGNNGGLGSIGSGYISGAGGGGKGSVGQAMSDSGHGSNGGAGQNSSITGSAVGYAGGGGGCRDSRTSTAGGVGTHGGGHGEATNSPSAGTVNTGGGAGGARSSGPYAGGSGIVIIRYEFQ